MGNVKNILKDSIDQSEYILVGLGEEWTPSLTDIITSDEFTNRVKKLPNSEDDLFYKDIITAEYYQKISNDNIKNAYQSLLNLIKDKNYFIVSINKDRYPIQIGMNPDQCVFPCGGYTHFQCSKNCSEAVLPSDEYVKYYIENIDQNSQELDSAPKCPFCGSKLVFNNINAQPYCEAGYIEQWQKYMFWLQKTINHSLCVLELGVSDIFKNVIHSPFEKTVYFNQKSKMFRIQNRSMEIPDNINERCIGIQENSVDFIVDLNN